MPSRAGFVRLLAAAGIIVGAGCTVPVVTVTVTVPPETVVVTATPSPSPPLPTSAPKVLTACVVGEPDTLYLYGGSQSSASQHVMSALYDGPVDFDNYAQVPVILKRIPAWSSGDVVTHSVVVSEGDTVVDAAGQVHTLSEGLAVRPAGCYAEDCAVTFEGGPVRMEYLEVTMELREDVKWSDGRPVRAADSVLGYQIASDPTTPGTRYLADRTRSYGTVGDWRVRWTGLPGFIEPGDTAPFFPPLPRHQLGDWDASELVGSEEMRRRPMGWGPFVVEHWRPGEYVALSRNPYYYRSAEGLPSVDRVIFRFAENAADSVSRVLSGECDIAARHPDFVGMLPFLLAAQENGLLTVLSEAGAYLLVLDLGLGGPDVSVAGDPLVPVEVRQALVQCIDRQAIVDEASGGRAIVADSYLPPAHHLFAEDVERWQYDPATGRILLEQVGWQDGDEDGVLEARSVEGVRRGTEFETTLFVSAESEMSRVAARIIRANLFDCGIRVSVEVVAEESLRSIGTDEMQAAGTPISVVERPVATGSRAACEPCGPVGLAGGDQSDEDDRSETGAGGFLSACTEVTESLPGSPMNYEAVDLSQLLFAKELPCIPLFFGPLVGVTGPRVSNYVLAGSDVSEFTRIEGIVVE